MSLGTEFSNHSQLLLDKLFMFQNPVLKSGAHKSNACTVVDSYDSLGVMSHAVMGSTGVFYCTVSRF